MLPPFLRTAAAAGSLVWYSNGHDLFSHTFPTILRVSTYFCSASTPTFQYSEFPMIRT